MLEFTGFGRVSVPWAGGGLTVPATLEFSTQNLINAIANLLALTREQITVLKINSDYSKAVKPFMELAVSTYATSLTSAQRTRILNRIC